MGFIKLKVPKVVVAKETPCPPAKPEWQKQKPPSAAAIVDSVLAARRKPREGYFRPSGIHGCDRSNVYHYLLTPEEPVRQDNRMLKILDIGTVLHSLFQKDYFSEHPDIFFTPEPKVSAFVGPRAALVQGHSDGLLQRRSDGFSWTLEIKTSSPNVFKDLKAPKPEHVLQASIYARLLGTHWISFYYFCKGTSNVKEFQVPMTEQRWEAIVKRVTHLKKFVDRGKLPMFDEKTCDPSFCRYPDRCSRDPNGRPDGWQKPNFYR